MASFLPSLLLLLQRLLLQLLKLLLLLLRLEDQLHLLVNLLALLLLLQMLLLLILLFLIAFLNSSAVRLTFLLLQLFLAGRDVFRSKAPANSFSLLLNIFRVSSHLDLRNLAFLVSNTQAQEEINFLDFRASRVVVDSHRSSLVAVDRDRESVLLDGLKELIDVKSRFLSLHLQLHVNSKLSWQRNFHLSFRKSALDGLQFLSLDDGFVFSNRLRSGERMDIVADNGHLSLVLGLFSLLQGNLDLSISVRNLNSGRDNSVERCLNTSTMNHGSASNTSGNTSADLFHEVADRLQLHANLGSRSRFRFQFNFSFGKSDKGVPDMHVDLQTRFSGVDRFMSINVKDLKVFKFHSSFKLFLVTFHVFSDFSDDFSGILLIKGIEVLKTQESQEKSSFRLFLLLTIDHELADLLFNLSLVLSKHRFRNIFLASEFRVHFKQLVKNVLSSLHIENRLNKFSISTQSLHLDSSVDRPGVDRFLREGQGQLGADSRSHTLDKAGSIKVARILNSFMNRLSQRQNSFSLHLDGFIFRNRVRQLAQTLQGRVDVGRNLSGGFKPSSDSQLLKVSSGGRAVHKTSYSSHSDLRVFSSVLNQGQEDRPVDTGVFKSSPDKLVHSNRSGMRARGDSSFNNFKELLGGFFKAKVAKSIDISDDRSHFSPGGFLQLSNQEGDKFLLDDRHLLIANFTIDLGGEFSMHGNWANAGLVDKFSETHNKSSSDNSVSLDVFSLQELNKFTNNFLSRGFDRPQSLGNDERPSSRVFHVFTSHNLFLDKLDTGVGTSNGHQVVESHFNQRFILLLSKLRLNSLFNFLQLFIAQLSNDAGSNNSQTSNVLFRDRAFTHLLRSLNKLSENLDGLFLQFASRFKSGDEHVGGRSQVRKRDGGTNSSALGQRRAGRVFKNKRGILLGRRRSRKLLSDAFNRFQDKSGDGRNINFRRSRGNLVLSDNLSDDMVLNGSADDGSGNRRVRGHRGRLRSISEGPGSVALVVDRALTAFVVVHGLQDFKVFLSFTKASASSLLFLKLSDEVFRKPGDGVKSFTLASDRSFMSGEGGQDLTSSPGGLNLVLTTDPAGLSSGKV